MLASTAYLVTGCEQSVAELHSADLPIEYVNVSTELIEDGMVRIRVDVRHAKQDAAVFYFANCAAARYAINGGTSKWNRNGEKQAKGPSKRCTEMSTLKYMTLRRWFQ